MNLPLSGLFIDHAGSERALGYALEVTFPLFSLQGKLAVPFSKRKQGSKIDQQANAAPKNVTLWLSHGRQAGLIVTSGLKSTNLGATVEAVAWTSPN
jgi:hypothetical protein